MRLRSVERRAGGACEIWAKCEFANPGGSVKDRAAAMMITDALAAGTLRPGQRLIDSTSGNTGVAYAMIGAALAIPITLVMPGNVSRARKQIVRAYGADVIYSSELEGSDGAIRLVRDILADEPDRWFYPDQYSNPANPKAHYLGTGGELVEALGDRLTHFVAGIGTTGTVMGAGRRLKEARPEIEVVAVEPEDALHGLEGLKHLPSSIVPPIWRPEGIVDRLLPMPTEEAWDAADALVTEEGLYVGHSAGAAVAGACRVARAAGPGAVVATIIPDEVLAVVRAEARRAYPAECCGFLVGPRGGDAVTRARPCVNAAGGGPRRAPPGGGRSEAEPPDRLHPTAPERGAETAYVITGEDLLALARSLDGPEPARIIYHSHPNGRAYFSATDEAVARDPWGDGPMYPVQQLVVGIDAERVTEARLYDWDAAAGKFVEIWSLTDRSLRRGVSPPPAAGPPAAALPPAFARSLAVIVSTPPERGDFERAEALARAARARGLEVGLFLMSEAAVWGADARAAALVDDGCDVVVCGTSLGERRAAAGVVVGSQDDHAALVHRADRVVALT